jgi:hypothetical protein
MLDDGIVAVGGIEALMSCCGAIELLLLADKVVRDFHASALVSLNKLG